MHALELRGLTALDLDLAASLHADAFAPLGERSWSRRDVAELLASPGVAGLVLRDDGKDVGFALHRIVADEAELLTIAVDRRHRRRGGGGRLLLGVAFAARANGARRLLLEVGADNPAARALYEQAGFRAIGLRGAYYRRGAGPAADAVVMELTLD
jgi:ribosomal-protein-alanine N-acetyltransferase